MKTYLPYSLLYLFFFSNISIANNDTCASKDESIAAIQTKNTVKLDNAGNLIYTDIIGVNDNINIVLEGTNYRLSNTAVALTAGNKVKQDGNSVLVPIALVRGKIIINTQGGDDTFTIDFSKGDFNIPINYNGGEQNTATGDDMILISADRAVYDTVTHTFVNNNDGFVDITGNNRISYIGLEPITDNLNTANRIFTFTNTSYTESVLDASGSLDNRIDSNQSESVDFNNPSNSLTINATNTGQNRMYVRGLDAGFNANLIVNAEDSSDEIQFNVNPTDIGNGHLNLTVNAVFILENTTAGAVTCTSGDLTFIGPGATLLSDNGGNISIAAGTVFPNIHGLSTELGRIQVFGHIQTTGSGSITLDGTTFGPNNTFPLSGIRVGISASIISDTGNISLTGQGTEAGFSADFRGIEIDGSSIIQSNGGNITLTGTGRDVADNFNLGISMTSGTTIQTAGTGSMIITGTGYRGMELHGTFNNAAGSGNISIQSAGETVNTPALLLSSSTKIFAGNNAILSTTQGPMITANGIAPQALIEANNVFINGHLIPGQSSPGQLVMDGNLIMSSDDTLDMEMNGFATAGSDYDQIVVNGSVDISGATLLLQDNTNTVPNQDFVIINNDGTDPIVGQFNGLPQGASITGNGKTWNVYYDQGDGNDVALIPTMLNPNIIVDGSGNLVYSNSYSENNNLTIVIDGANYRVSDTGNFVLAGTGATQDGNDALVPIASITGAININAENGNDNLTVDLSGGNFSDAINFDGGNNSDGLSLSGVSTFNTVTHTVNSSGNKTISITGNSTISHTNLEQAIVDNLAVDNRVFTLNSSNHTVFEATGNIENRVVVSGLATIDYNNPNTSLEVNGTGVGQGSNQINGFATGFDAGVNFDKIGDSVSFGSLSTNTDINIGIGDFTVLATTISVRDNVTTGGLIRLISLDAIDVDGGDLISSAGQNITIFGGTQSTMTSGFSGLNIENSTIQTTGTGTITLFGTAFQDTTASFAVGMQLVSTNLITNTGDISITGIGPATGSNFSTGINMSTSTNIQSSGGNINITGTAGTSIGDNNKGVIIFDGALIETTGVGTITIEGTGGTGINTNYGIEMQANAIVKTENGTISMTGSSIDTSGNNQDGLFLEGTVNTTGTGNISITGTSGTANDSSINLASNGAQLLAGGNLVITGNQGSINTPSGVSGQNQFSAIKTTVGGILTPGQSPGQLTVAGNLTMNSGNTLEMEVTGFTTAGTDFDQIIVNGTVNLNGVTFNLLDTSASFSSAETLILIANDGADAINGTFNGLPQGALIAGNEKNWNIYYDQGDGNDVVLISSAIPNVIVDGSGNMVYTGINLDDDNLTIIVENTDYRLSDSGKPVTAGAGTTQDGNDVLVPITSITGAININTGDGNDNLTVNLNGGNFSDAINFDGGSNSDGLTLSGGVTFNTVTHTVNSVDDGTIAITGNSPISHAGLEQAIIDNLAVDDRIFTLDTDAFILFEPTGSLENQVAIDGLINIDYNNPNNSLTLNGSGTGTGFIAINGFATGFDADINISRLKDTVRFGFNSNVGIDFETGNINVHANTVLVRVDVTTEGAISLISLNGTYVEAGDIISSAGEDITITAGTQPTTSGFSGIEIFESTIQASGTGSITLHGTAFLNNNLSGAKGITLFGINLITDTGDINITGIGAANGSFFSAGVNMSISTNIQSSGGNINIIGTGGNSLGHNNKGIIIFDSALIETTGAGAIVINGTGGTGTDTNYGIEIQANAIVRTENGNISMTGSSIDDTGVDQIGFLVNGIVNTTGSGNISITGTSSTANYSSINLLSSASQFNAGGTLQITGNTGPINTPSGISGQNQFSGTTTTLDGILAPGQSPGQLTIAGNFIMNSGDTLEIEATDFDTAGTEYDQIVVNGTVNLNGAALNLTDSSGSFSSPENLIIIDNDGTDPVVGTFNGLPNGAVIAGNGKSWYIYYNLGGTNDVLLSTTPPNIQIDGSGNLVFQDPYSLNDNLTIIVEGTNYRISDSVKPIIAGPGTTQDGNDVLITIVDVTGDINMNTGEGDDFLNVNFDGGDIANAINYDGENGVDGITLVGTNTHNNIAHTITGNKIGFIDISNNGIINYTGLEHTIRDYLDANDRVFTFEVQASRIILEQASASKHQVYYLNGTRVEFNNPLNSLTIDGEFGFQNGIFATTFVDIETMGSGFDADLIINRVHDNVRFIGVNATDLGSGNLNITASSLDLFYHDVTTTGSVITTSKRVTNIRNTTIQAEGDISITSGTLVLPNNIVTSGLSSGHLKTTGSGNIIINGTAYAAFNTNNTTLDGFYMIQSSSITTDAGDITIIGNGVDNGNAKFRGLRLQESSNIQSNTGNITINGTGRNNNNNSNIGVSMLAGTTIQTAGTGAINITGTGWIGQEIDGIIRTTGTGNVWLHGTSGAINASAINLPSSNAQLQSGGFLYLISSVGPVNTPSGITSQIQFNGHTSLNGVLAPGQSPGQLIVTGNLAIGSSNNTLEMEVNGFTTAGSDYDQVVVNGIVNINGATLTLVDTSGAFTNTETLVLIDNDATDAVIGTFNGLPNGSSIAGNGKTWYIYYNEGDGNDVILSSELLPNIMVDGSGNLVFSDIYSANDNLTIIVDGTNYRISDSGKAMIAGSGVTQDGNDALVPIASVTGAININTESGVDNLNIDFDGGNFVDTINLDGGSQPDKITLSGTNIHNTVNHTFNSTTSGSIDITNNSTITYTELASSIMDNLDVNNRVFTPNVNNQVIMETSGILGNHIAIIGGAGLSLHYKNPLNSLTFTDTGLDNSYMDVKGVAAGFDADFTINREDTYVSFRIIATDIGSGNLNVTSDRLVISKEITTTGSITTSSKNEISIHDATVLSGGNVSMTAGTDITSLGESSIEIDNAHIQTTGSGNITLNGNTFIHNITSNILYGVQMEDGSSIINEDGNITITGNGIDNGNADFGGVLMDESSTILSSTGNIVIEGTSNMIGVSAINLVSTDVQIQTGGNLTVTANLGSINTPSGVTSQAQFNANQTTINGILTPGQSPGQLNVDGNFEMNSGDTLEMEVNNFTTAGTDYDQIVVKNGLVDITGTTLTLVDNSGVFGEDPEMLVLIDNDGTDPITGTFNGLPNGSTIAGNSKTWYIYYDKGDGNDVVLSSDILDVSKLSPKVYLQGASLSPNQGEETLMRDDLRVTGIIPTTSPYADALTVNAAVFNTTGPDAIVDWIWVEIRNEFNSSRIMASQSALLQRDGDIVGIDGTSPLSFQIQTGNYHIGIKHRNHLSIMNASTVVLNSATTTVDFTNGSTATFGSNAQTTSGMPTGIQGMWAGDVNNDGIVQYSGGTADSPSILSLVLNDAGNFLNFPTYLVNGYNNQDINMDGITQYVGGTSELPFLLQNVLSYPANFLNLSTWPIEEQLPINL